MTAVVICPKVSVGKRAGLGTRRGQAVGGEEGLGLLPLAEAGRVLVQHRLLGERKSMGAGVRRGSSLS